MGWCSGTEIFDGVIDVIAPIVEPERLPGIAEHIAEMLWNGDWDCEEDSKYYDELLVDIMYKRGYMDKEDYDYIKAGRPDDWDWDNDD